MAAAAVERGVPLWRAPVRPLEDLFTVFFNPGMVDGLCRGDEHSYERWRTLYLQWSLDVNDLLTILEEDKEWTEPELGLLLKRYRHVEKSFSVIRSTLVAAFAVRQFTRSGLLHGDRTFLTRDIQAFDKHWEGMTKALADSMEEHFADIRYYVDREWRIHEAIEGYRPNASWEELLVLAEEARADEEGRNPPDSDYEYYNGHSD